MNARAKFFWTLRREVWEHRAIYIAPLAVAALVLIAFLFGINGLAEKLRVLNTLTPAKQAAAVATPFGIAASVVLFTSFMVALFYCLDALYGERRDRSILFWKSMPVSDLLTVAAKVTIPLVVQPLVAFVIALATQAILLVVGAAILAAHGIDLSAMWSRLPLVQMTVVMLYGLVIHSLWYAPIYAWLLLVSAWAKKAPFLWAVLPVFGALVIERIAIGTSKVFSLVRYRVAGAMDEAYVGNAMNESITRISQLDPARFFSNVYLWIGLAFAVAFLAAAIQMRRHREPI